MHTNDPQEPQSERPAEGRVKSRRSTGLKKAQRYLGLIAVVWLAYALLSPRSVYGSFSGPNPRPFIFNESYHHRTVLSDLVLAINSEEAWEVKLAGEYIEGCETAKRLVSADGRDLSIEALLANTERLPSGERITARQTYEADV
jgi:hypothetical protein